MSCIRCEVIEQGVKCFGANDPSTCNDYDRDDTKTETCNMQPCCGKSFTKNPYIAPQIDISRNTYINYITDWKVVIKKRLIYSVLILYRLIQIVVLIKPYQFRDIKKLIVITCNSYMKLTGFYLMHYWNIDNSCHLCSILPSHSLYFMFTISFVYLFIYITLKHLFSIKASNHTNIQY